MGNFEKAVKRPFTDFTKMLIGTLLSILPVVKWIVKGYHLECAGVGKTHGRELPDWHNFKAYFVRGFFAVVIKAIYLIPAIILLGLSLGKAILLLLNKFLASGISVEALATEQGANAFIDYVVANTSFATSLLTSVFPILIAGILVWIVLGYFIPAATLNYVKKNNFKAAFRFREIRKRAMTKKYFVAWLIGGFLTVVIRRVLIWIPFVGAAVGYYIGGVMFYTLVGDAFRKR